MTCCPFFTLWSSDLMSPCSRSSRRTMAHKWDAACPASSYCEEDDAGGLHGVLGGQHDPAVVDPAIEVRVRRPAHGEVPLEEVVLQERRGEEGKRDAGHTLQTRQHCDSSSLLWSGNTVTDLSWEWRLLVVIILSKCGQRIRKNLHRQWTHNQKLIIYWFSMDDNIEGLPSGLFYEAFYGTFSEKL